MGHPIRIFVMPAFMACLFSALAFAQSQENDHPQSAAESGNNPKGGEQITIKSPVSVKLIPAPISAEESSREAKEKAQRLSNETKSTDANERVAGYTKILIIVGIAQVIIYALQSGFLYSTLTQSKKAVRAYVVVLHGIQVDAARAAFLRIVYKNCGQTPAYNLGCTFDIKIFDKWHEQWPANEPFIVETKVEGSRAPLAAGEPLDIPIDLTNHVKWPLVKESWPRISKGEASLFFIGRATYKDVFGKSQKTEFCFRQRREQNLGFSMICRDHNEST